MDGNSWGSLTGWDMTTVGALTGGATWQFTKYSGPTTATTGGAAVNVNLNQPQGEYGAAIPISMGTRRVGPPQLIWAKAIYGDATSGYFADFAFGWGYNGDSDPSATQITKLWANGSLIWDGGTKILPGDWSVTLYTGTETQTADPTIVAAGGAASGLRGTMYGVFTGFPITQAWGYSIPGITAEISGALGDGGEYVVIDFTWTHEPFNGVICQVVVQNSGSALDGVLTLPNAPYVRRDNLWSYPNGAGQSILVDLGAIKQDYPDVTSLDLELRATWNEGGDTQIDRDVTVTVTNYQGGTMAAPTYNDQTGTPGTNSYTNSGGTELGSSTVTVSIASSKSDYGSTVVPYDLIETKSYELGAVQPADGITIKQLIERVGVYAGLDPTSDIHIDPAITDTAAGAIIGAETVFGEFAQNLGRWFGFDMFEGDRINFIRPVSGTTYTVDRTIPPADLLNQGDRSITTTRGEDNSPVLLEGKYIDQSQQFRFNAQRARRILFPTRSTDSDRRMALAVPVVLTANEAMTYLGRAIYRMAAQNVLHQFSLPPRYLDIEPGDILAITAGTTSYTVKVMKVEIGPQLAINVSAVNLFTQEDISLTGDSGSPLAPYDGTTVPAVLTSPTISGTAQEGETLTTTDGTFSNGATVTRQWQSSADGTTWADITGETGTTYTIATGSAGKRIRVKDTGTAGGKSAVAYSDAVGPIASAPAGGTATYGTNDGTTWTVNNDEISLAVITTPADMASLSSITIPKNSGYSIFAGSHFKGLVYNPTTLALIAAGDEITTTDGMTEVVLTFSTPITLSPSTSYAFGVFGDDSLTIQSSYTTDSFIVAAAPYASGAPDPIGTHSTGSGSFVFTITYTPA